MRARLEGIWDFLFKYYSVLCLVGFNVTIFPHPLFHLCTCVPPGLHTISMFNWRSAKAAIMKSLLTIILTHFSLSSAKISFYNRETKGCKLKETICSIL